ncbi:peptidoglycan-binding protein [Streptomyces sp. Act143]|uniref:peptidoglycan-binding domain-containing protein n=1 Tax=Streptomyces sp. Act143 TaxID=2200760 RepID=UPI000D676C82|nr:peptidoglycan-binding domain-containing protein [Streptomyces sp. Act143]PWI14795.1 peptidoglycan-binding protein [Streptomyces sp. Act143]
MSEQAGPVCPECGTARAADGTPACTCARRASDAHRAGRTAEAAAAEDFDPVRIRPFVEVGDDGDASDVRDAPAAPGDPAAEPADGVGELPSPASLPEVPVTTSAAEPGPHGLGRARRPDGTARQRRGRRTLLTIGLGAAGGAVLTGCLVGGLFWYDGPDRDDSLSGGVRAGLPDEQASETVAPSPATSRAASPTQPATSATASAEPSATGGPPTPTGTTGPTATASGATPTATGGGPTPSSSGGQTPVLRPGDSGPEVVELQLRLRQVGLYGGEADGTYDDEVQSAVRGYQVTRVILGDESGVYGPRTRAALESETSEP